jgi:hypothetical protein
MARGFAKESLMNLSIGLTDDENVTPEELPEAGRFMSVETLRAMGLPFACNTGEVIQDQSLTLAEELHDAERESRLVYFTFTENGNTLYGSVQYTRPVDCAITATFEPWPDESDAFVTLYDADDMGKLRVRQVASH